MLNKNFIKAVFDKVNIVYLLLKLFKSIYAIIFILYL